MRVGEQGGEPDCGAARRPTTMRPYATPSTGYIHRGRIGLACGGQTRHGVSMERGTGCASSEHLAFLLGSNCGSRPKRRCSRVLRLKA